MTTKATGLDTKQLFQNIGGAAETLRFGTFDLAKDPPVKYKPTPLIILDKGKGSVADTWKDISSVIKSVIEIMEEHEKAREDEEERKSDSYNKKRVKKINEGSNF